MHRSKLLITIRHFEIYNYIIMLLHISFDSIQIIDQFKLHSKNAGGQFQLWDAIGICIGSDKVILTDTVPFSVSRHDLYSIDVCVRQLTL